MKKFPNSLLAALLAAPLALCPAASAQDESGGGLPFADKPLDQLTGDEVLRLVRYSYTLYDQDFSGVLRTGIARRVPFTLSLKPESIRFIFDDPPQMILLDTSDSRFSLYEGVDGGEMKPVSSSRYGETIRDTDVTYDDLSMRFLYWPNASIVAHDRVKQRDCWRVRVVNPDGHGSYASVDLWIDKESGGLLRMLGYNSQGRTIRRYEVLSGRRFGDVWMVDDMRIETISPAVRDRIESSTRMQIRSAGE